MDPDYEHAQAILEEAHNRRELEHKEQIHRATEKVSADFQKLLGEREDQLVDIQNRITSVAKTLHVLRFVLVSAYYNKQEAQLQAAAADLRVVDEQPRLHPAVKALINDRQPLPTFDCGKPLTRRRRRAIVLPIENEEQSKETKPAVSSDSLPTSTSTLTSRSEDEEGSTSAVIRNRAMRKRRIIIGNISKWMPSDNAEDSSTHKWMVYVRGPPEQPRIDDFVEKVVFHLHPSYHPQDIIEITNYPFHLTRRGWGEFPLRCKLFFINALNKPVSIIHQLKLDKTFSGRQTLGGETVVELTLYDDAFPDEENTDVVFRKIKFEATESDQPEDTTPMEEHEDPIVKMEVCEEEVYLPEEDIADTSVNDVVQLETVPLEVCHDELCPALFDHTYSIRKYVQLCAT